MLDTQNTTRIVTMPVADLSKALTLLSKVIDNGVVVLDTAPDVAAIRSSDSAHSMALPVLSGVGCFELGIDPKYLLAAIKQISTDAVYISVDGDSGSNPVRISAHGSGTEKFFVIMPKRH